MKRLAIATLLMLGISGCITPVSYHIPQSTPKGKVSAGAAITYWGSTTGFATLPYIAPFIRYGLTDYLDFGFGFEGLPVFGLTNIDVKYQFLQGNINGSLRLGVGAQLVGFVPYASLSFGTNTVYGGLGVQYFSIDAGELFSMKTVTPQGFIGFMLGIESVKFVPELNVMVPITEVKVFGQEATTGVILFKLGIGVAYIPSK
jgi:hypothetical protein